MAKKAILKQRSGCPVSIALDLFGDRWSLLIVRDMMVRGYRTFREFQNSGEGIATNILASRLRRLKAAGILTTEPLEEDRRSVAYRLTEKGIALAPVLLELLIWSGNHEKTAAPGPVIQQMESSRQAILDETYHRWREHDDTPLIPPFGKSSSSANMPTPSRKGRRSR